jgi:hypothetical protein
MEYFKLPDEFLLCFGSFDNFIKNSLLSAWSQKFECFSSGIYSFDPFLEPPIAVILLKLKNRYFKNWNVNTYLWDGLLPEYIGLFWPVIFKSKVSSETTFNPLPEFLF